MTNGPGFEECIIQTEFQFSLDDSNTIVITEIVQPTRLWSTCAMQLYILPIIGKVEFSFLETLLGIIEQ